MKKLFILLSFILLIIPSVFADLSTDDQDQIANQIGIITDSLDSGDTSSILNIISPNARPGLADEIRANIAGKSIQLEQTIDTYEELENNQVMLNGVFSASGPGWSVNGISNFYVFEKTENSWLLVDTDFHQKLSSDYALKIIGIIFAILIPIFIILGAFWLWMLIDAIKREFENKTMWIVLIVLLSTFGAALYFFMVRRQLRIQEKLQKQQQVPQV